MKKVNDALMVAARNGDEAGIKAILLRPGCDSMLRNNDGWTALMFAAGGGHASCAQLLIPVSDALAKNKQGRTASELARSRGKCSLASFIDAYTLAVSEMSELGSLVGPGGTSKKTSPRV